MEASTPELKGAMLYSYFICKNLLNSTSRINEGNYPNCTNVYSIK
jgi:hypothetical protein